MKILLLGEYSNVHATLARGLRRLGHEVTVASNGDFWRSYPRDIELDRRQGHLGGMALLMKVMACLPRWRGYDVVQLINPMFLELKAERIRPVYRYLRRHNSLMVLGAYGMDYYWVHENVKRMPLRYSDFNIGKTLRNNKEAIADRADWTDTPKGELNRLIAHDCDAIVAGLYEYFACYKPLFPDKTTFIPFPIDVEGKDSQELNVGSTLKIFVGISKERSSYKGTDIMLRAAKAVEAKYPTKVCVKVANGLPFEEYVKMMNGSDVILDQLYSYTPAMNALEAMSRGVVVVGGGEEENYEILGEDKLRPIVNVMPDYEDVYRKIEALALHPEDVARRKLEGVEYVRKHHDMMKVARCYEQLYLSKMK